MKDLFRKMCFVLLACGILAGCGVKGDPQPDFDPDRFAFGELSAVLSVDGTVTVSGELTGAFQNLDFIVLEMQPVDSELCVGCPFLPQDQYRIDARDAWESAGGSSFSAVYLPMFPAEMYRWRLVGHNIYSGINVVTSPVSVVGTESAYIEQGMPSPSKGK